MFSERELYPNKFKLSRIQGLKSEILLFLLPLRKEMINFHMLNLLEEYYKSDIVIDKFHYRKVYIDEKSYQIHGVTQSGKTKLIKNYLLSLKKNTYLYINCADVRIDLASFNESLTSYCIDNKIDTLVLDNFTPEFQYANVSQLILISQEDYKYDFLESIQLYPLDYEEFLAYEHKYDATALNHFFQLGGFAHMHKVTPDERNNYIQKSLRLSLASQEFEVLKYCAKVMAQKVSPFSIYERLKLSIKVSKDKLYKSYDALVQKKYIHTLSKLKHTKATKKLYLCDISLKPALSIGKHFGRLFENMIFLELLKHDAECYYDEGIEFYLPQNDEIILPMPFAEERALFKKIQIIEEFIFTYQIKKITIITMSREGSINHPLSEVEMIPFDIWALGD